MGVGAPYSYSPGLEQPYPAEFQNDVFFTDVNTGRVFVVDIDNRSDVKYLYSSQGAPVAFSQGPDGHVYVANLQAGTITKLLITPSDHPIGDPNSASEKELEALNESTGWIPVWGSLLSAVSLISDLNDMLIALQNNNSPDIADEAGDLVEHVLGIGLGLFPEATHATRYHHDEICMMDVTTQFRGKILL